MPRPVTPGTVRMAQAMPPAMSPFRFEIPRRSAAAARASMRGSYSTGGAARPRRSGGAGRTPLERGGHACPAERERAPEDPLRQEDDEQHEEYAVDEVVPA